MNMEIEILLGTAVIAALSFGTSLFCMAKQRRCRILLEQADKQIETLETLMQKSRETIEVNADRLAEQTRRTAWLESKVRQPKKTSDDVLDDTLIHETPKLNITERRHRVVTLASRGQNAESIASALGMLRGEVELIIDINRAAQNKK